LKIGIVQPSNVKSAIELTETVLSKGAQLVLLPEKWVKTLDEVPLSDFQRLALKYTAYIIPGAIEDGVSVIAPIIDNSGKIKGIAKKLHLFGKEKDRLLPGDKSIIFTYSGIKFGISICYDIDFPETIRNMFKKGVEILLVPSKITTEGLKIWRDYIKIRALENRIAIVNANALAPPDYIGNSFAITPVKKGGIVDTLTVAELGEEENYTIADIDPLTYFHLRLERLKEISDTSVDEI